MSATRQREEIPPGTLEMLILKTLARNKAMHGFEIAEFILETSNGVLQVEEGSLYPALQRMLLKNWLVGDWGKTDENRRARYYSLTAEGRKQLVRELDRYARVSQAIAAILQPV
ncbi:MAG TPA: PadR family transcriptional regulator [Bryobacteraceae bacterium]|nr:PadR family transcriptional regulator [Bryobacteraceae bacterium]